MPKQKTRLSFIFELNEFLLYESKRGNNAVLIIDEAQNLTPKALEQIRLLSNLETEKNKLIQIILVGQPQLNHKLNLFQLRQLQQRVMVKYHITPLDKIGVKNYIDHRLNIAGSENKIKFTDEAMQLITDFSYGVPRLINIICDRSLLAGFVAETDTIDLNIIKRCIEELNSYFVKP